MKISALVSLALASIFSTITLADDSDVTYVDKDFFRLELPGNWMDVTEPTDELLWDYESVEYAEKVTVSLILASQELVESEISALSDTYLDTRRKSELSVGGAGVTLGEVQTKYFRGAILADYSGANSDGRRFRNRVVTNSNGIANFYYESLDFDEGQFEERSSAVLSKVGFVGK